MQLISVLLICDFLL